MEKKYKFTDETKNIGGKIFHRIVAIKEFQTSIGIIKKGTVGGYIESEDNLSQEDGVWVSGNARVYDDARVAGNALICGNAWIYNNAQVSGNALIYGNAWIYNNAQVSGNALISGNARVYGDARVSGNAQVYNNARVSGNARVYNNARVFGNVWVYNNAWVYGNAWIYNNAQVSGNARVSGNAFITSLDDISTVSGFGSENRTTTFYLSKDNEILVSCGCFHGTLKQFRDKVKITHGGTHLGQEYLIIADLMEMRFNRVIESKEEK